VTLPNAVQWTASHVVAPQQRAQEDTLPSVCLPAAAEQIASVRETTQLTLPSAVQGTTLPADAPQQRAIVDALPSVCLQAAADRFA
jgi:hypothetical protein